jgi:hypothetical protein
MRAVRSQRCLQGPQRLPLRPVQGARVRGSQGVLPTRPACGGTPSTPAAAVCSQERLLCCPHSHCAPSWPHSHCTPTWRHRTPHATRRAGPVLPRRLHVLQQRLHAVQQRAQQRRVHTAGDSAAAERRVHTAGDSAAAAERRVHTTGASAAAAERRFDRPHRRFQLPHVGCVAGCRRACDGMPWGRSGRHAAVSDAANALPCLHRLRPRVPRPEAHDQHALQLRLHVLLVSVSCCSWQRTCAHEWAAAVLPRWRRCADALRALLAPRSVTAPAHTAASAPPMSRRTRSGPSLEPPRPPARADEQAHARCCGQPAADCATTNEHRATGTGGAGACMRGHGRACVRARRAA